MERASSHRTLWSLEDLSARQAAGLIALARALQRDASRSRPLSGRHVAVLCRSTDGPSATAFTAAAEALGALAVRIDPETAGLGSPDSVREAAPLLGRLYEAIQCDGMDETLMRELEQHAGVPVYNEVAACGHPTRLLADLMAIQDRPQRAGAAAELGVAGSGQQRWHDIWDRLAQLTGGALRVSPASGAAAPPGRVAPPDFVCDTEHPLSADGHPSLLARSTQGGAAVSLAELQQAHHGYVVQALLSSTMG